MKEKKKMSAHRTLCNAAGFKLSLLSLCIMGTTSNVHAQDAIEEVVVTGIRASAQRAMDVKRDAAGVVDAISAEDIGKFPDTNLAESLQRITGVSISRADGEGSQVTVRGFGADFNMITLNGRAMPAAAVNPQAAPASRAFEFSNIASESVSGIEVYKTSRANIASGGIGATINIRTARPLDNPGLKLSVGAKAVHDTTVIDGDNITPEVSAIFSWTDAEEKFGVGLFLSHQERHSAAPGAYVNQWNTRAWDGTNFNSANITNAPDQGQLFATPSDIRYTIADRERTRDNAQLVLQFSPVESLVGTLDYTYSETELFETRAEQMLWFENAGTSATFDDAAVATPVLYAEAPGGKDMSWAQQERNQLNENDSVGLNVSYDFSDDFSLSFDYHDSTAESSPNAPYGSWTNVSFGARVVGTQTVDWRPDLPIQMLTVADPAANNNGVLDIDDIGSQVIQNSYAAQKTDIEQARLDGSLRFDLDLAGIEEGVFEFGVESREMSSATVFAQSNTAVTTMGDWGISNPGDIPNGFLSPRDLTAEFEDFSTSGAWTQGFDANPVQVGVWGGQTYGFAFTAPLDNISQNSRVEEDVTAAYVQLALSGAVADMPANLTIGLRYEDTDVRSSSAVRNPSSILWQDNNDFSVQLGTQSTSVVEDAGYDNVLPSIDFDIEFIEGLIGRISYGKTLARAKYDQLDASIGIDTPSGVTDGIRTTSTASRGSARLQPLESKNLDLSLEWYFDDASYVSIGYYEKSVKNFIGNASVIESHFGLRDATAGPRAQAARAALLNDFGVANPSESQLFAMVAATENGVTYEENQAFWDLMGGSFDITANADDPLFQFTTGIPVNNRKADIDGFEFAVQYFHDQSGLGVHVNYTTVDGDIGFDVTGDPNQTQFALVGLSDTANVILMYENYGVQARLAYNWRDEFLSNANRFANNPEFTEAYEQVDLNIGYEVNDQLTVFFEGLNLTEENTRSHGRSDRQLWNLEDLGARYQIGARYTF